MTDKDCPLCKNERWIGVADISYYAHGEAKEKLKTKRMIGVRTIAKPCPECEPDGFYGKNKNGEIALLNSPLIEYVKFLYDYPDALCLATTEFYLWLRRERPLLFDDVVKNNKYGFDFSLVNREVIDFYDEQIKKLKGRSIKSLVTAATHEIKNEWNQGSERAAEAERTAKQLRFMPDEDVPF